MLRITDTSEDGEKVSLKLEGKLTDEWVKELEEICLHRKGKENIAILLDLSDVTFIDQNGLTILEKISDNRTDIINCPLFINSLIKQWSKKESREQFREPR